jgi:hypothetical protein
MGLYHLLDGDTNLKYKLLCLLTSNKKNQKFICTEVHKNDVIQGASLQRWHAYPTQK